MLLKTQVRFVSFLRLFELSLTIIYEIVNQSFRCFLKKFTLKPFPGDNLHLVQPQNLRINYKQELNSAQYRSGYIGQWTASHYCWSWNWKDKNNCLPRSLSGGVRYKTGFSAIAYVYAKSSARNAPQSIDIIRQPVRSYFGWNISFFRKQCTAKVCLSTWLRKQFYYS